MPNETIKADAAIPPLNRLARQKKLDHKCGQTTLTALSDTGEVVQLGFGD